MEQVDFLLYGLLGGFIESVGGEEIVLFTLYLIDIVILYHQYRHSHMENMP